MKKQKDQTPELLQLKNRLKAIEAEVKSKDEEIEDLREQVEIAKDFLLLKHSLWEEEDFARLLHCGSNDFLQFV